MVIATNLPHCTIVVDETGWAKPHRLFGVGALRLDEPHAFLGEMRSIRRETKSHDKPRWAETGEAGATGVDAVGRVLRLTASAAGARFAAVLVDRDVFDVETHCGDRRKAYNRLGGQALLDVVGDEPWPARSSTSSTCRSASTWRGRSSGA